jgi:mannitol-1-phosphate/altronate dehydrogenase
MRKEISSGKETGREKPVIKENPRPSYKAVFELILAFRQRQLPMNILSCGNQSANISLINRRKKFSLPFPLPGG